jgi:hypothetical protein
VRALVDAMEDVGTSPNGHRRFRKIAGEDTSFVELHAVDELLMGEEVRGPRGRTKAKHAWKKTTGGGWVRDRTDIESTEVVDGRTFTSRATLQIVDVKTNTPRP